MRYKNLKHNTFFFAFLFFNLQIYQRQRDGRQDDLNFFLLRYSEAFLLFRSVSTTVLFFRWTLGLNNRKRSADGIHHPPLTSQRGEKETLVSKSLYKPLRLVQALVSPLWTKQESSWYFLGEGLIDNDPQKHGLWYQAWYYWIQRVVLLMTKNKFEGRF